jgi:hypothetical protein
MEIFKVEDDLCGYFPDAVLLLHCEDYPPLFHESQQRRHPRAIYIMSLDTVLRRFSKLLNALDDGKVNDSVFEIAGSPAKEAIKDALDHLLDSLNEHLEDCRNVIKAFSPNHTSPSYLRSYKLFQSATKTYRDHISRIDNHLKHEQGRIRLAAQLTPHKLLGYYVDGVVGPGVSGPSPKVHSTDLACWSFSRDLRFHLVWVYMISRALNSAIRNLVGETHLNQPKDAKPSAQLNDVLWGITYLQPLQFPNERKLDTPWIELNTNGGKKYLRATTSFKPSPLLSAYGNFRVEMSNDGASKSFSLPKF